MFDCGDAKQEWYSVYSVAPACTQLLLFVCFFRFVRVLLAFRALMRFLTLWTQHGRLVPTVSGEVCRAKLRLYPSHFWLYFPHDFGTKDGAPKKGASSSAALSEASEFRSSQVTPPAKLKKGKKEPCVDVATAVMNDGLREFTRRTVLCRRCRRARTSLYATARSADRSSAPGGGSLSLWVECQEEGCRVTSEVSTDGGPTWLVKFAEYVLRRKWEVRDDLCCVRGRF